jgi:hypothetical protein
MKNSVSMDTAEHLIHEVFNSCTELSECVDTLNALNSFLVECCHNRVEFIDKPFHPAKDINQKRAE